MKRRPGTLGFRFFKRAMDILVSGLGLIVASPFLLIGAILVKAGSPGPILFKQVRLGRDERPFIIYKFRTMRVDAPSHVGAEDLKETKKVLPKFACFLRVSRMDELPQLWNIFRGDMSLIGPRPMMEAKYQVPLYEARKAQENDPFLVRPGLTGLAQLRMECRHDILEKAKNDGEYVRNFSFRQDFVIFFRTIPMVLGLIFRKG